MKKLTAVLLVALMLTTSLPMYALAAEVTESSEAVSSAETVVPEPETTQVTSDSQITETESATQVPTVGEASEETEKSVSTDDPQATATPKETVAPVGAQSEAQPVGKSSFTYSVSNNQVTITGLTDEYLTDLVIPETIENLPVTAIKENAFDGCSQITSITVPNSVTSIGSGAFKGTNPTKVTLPFIGSKRGETEQYSSVFGYAFGQISPTTDTTVQHYKDSKLLYYFIPKTIKEVIITDETVIPYGAFYNCSWIENISINYSVTTLCEYSFYNCSSLKSFVIPEGVTLISSYAFYNCKNLKSVAVPNTLKNYHSYCFYGCSSLESITLPDELTTIGDYAFSGCSSLSDSDLIIPNKVTTIGNFAFDGCSQITSITVPNNVTSIGNGAFKGTNPTKVTLPFIGNKRGETEQYSSVFGYAFGQISSTTDTTVQHYKDSKLLYYYIPKTIKEVIITDETVIPYGAFYNCSWIEKVTINDIEGDANLVGNNAFYYCKAMTVYINRDTAVHTYCERNGIRHCSTKSLTLENDSLVLFRNETGTIGSEVILLNGKVDDDPETVWTSSDPDVATVNRYTGVISAVAPGTTTITADSEGVTATAEVTVYFKLEGIALNKSTTEIDIDQSETLTVIYDPGNTSDNRDISWTSSDDTVASVDQSGVVTAHKKGKATITATGFGGVKATCTVQVLIPMTAITFDNSAVTIPRGTRQKVPFTVSPSNTTDTYTVTSSNESVATVDKFGNVTAKKIGTAVITVTSSRGLEQTCVVTVNSPASSITLSEDSKALFVGKTFTLTTEMSPKDTTDGVTWTSSDEDVAVVTPNGLVTAISKGNATITATADSGVSANCEVTVESDIAATTIYLAYQETDYDGDEKLPGVSVYYNGEKLVEDTDYCLSYLDNIDAGNASVYVTSLHDGTEVEKNFTIHPLTVKALDISYKTSMTYTGSPLKSVEEIIYQSLRLTEGTDYKLEYVNNTNAGQATVTISGLGNFSDSTTKTFTITPKSANQLTVTLGTTSYQYDGIAKEPTVTVKDGAKELTEGTDYEVRYSKNTNTGDAVVTVTGLNNYGGSTTAGFKIYAKSLADAQMSLGKTVFAFDGTEKRPEVTVTDGEVVLKENTDYKVEYKDNKESGTATATVTGQGNYTGTLAADFKIIRLGDINQNGTVEIQDVTVLQRHLAEFTNSDGTPIVDETNEEILKIADVDHNGEITIADITLIQRFLAEFTDTL